MARKLRTDEEGALHHVTARGNGKQAIFLDDRDRRMYLALLSDVIRRKRWRCLGFCLMDNHIHLLIETPEGNLAAGMQRLHGDYARYFNTRHDRVGHLFQGRYGAVRIESDEQLWAVARYIAANPVQAGLCELAEDWPWSSHALVLTGGGPRWLETDRLLEFFESDGGRPLARYRELVAET
jgi:REP element-mobilizing transposase RayT